MNQFKLRILAGTAAALLFSSVAGAQTFAATGTTALTVAVAAEAAISISTATTTLATASTAFGNPYTGTTNFLYKLRTTRVGGTGTLTLKVTTDFTGTGGGGPSVASPPTAGDALTYTCTTASGTACASAQTASTSSDTGVATFVADIHSVAAGDSGSVSWSLTDDPVYKTGSYTATVTFTIAST
jgi:hypothetical protein